MPAIFLDLLRYRVVEFVGGGALNGGVFEAAHPVKLCLFDEVKKLVELAFRFTGEADNEG